MIEPILKVENLKKYFPIRRGFFLRKIDYVKAVDDVSFFVNRGKTLGIVGESGCGKSTLGRTVLRLIEPTDGRIFLKGRNITELEGEELRKIREEMQIIFQETYSSLDPRMVARDLVAESLETHTTMNKTEVREKTLELFQTVGLNEDHLRRYPHEFSGGQQQRISIARALSLNPELLFLDEPTSALDVSVQAQILNLLKSLQREYKVTYVFISHNLSVVKYICDRVAVMYVGKIVEITSKKELFENSKHPYTKALLAAIPKQHPDIEKERKLLTGEPPSAIKPPSGCRFHPRCPYAMDICKKEEPQLKEVDKDHYVACHLYK